MKNGKQVHILIIKSIPNEETRKNVQAEIPKGGT